MSYSTFQEFSKDIVKDFIQNVVIIDDQATFDSPQASGKLIIPEATHRKVYKRQDQSEITQPVAETKAHSLYALELTDAFLQNGFLCSIVRPTTEKDIEYISIVADKADVVILDWELNIKSTNKEAKSEEFKNMALELLEKIIDKDKQNSPRLRLILIYTAEESLKDLVGADILKLLQDKNVNVLIKDESKLRYGNENLRIRIIGKKRSDLDNSNKYYEKDLPSVVYEEFINIASGLLPSLALISMTLLRKNTYKILSRFNSNLDPALLIHKVLLAFPDDCADHATQWISDEINSILISSNVGAFINEEISNIWIKENLGPKTIDGVKFEIDDLSKLNKEGIENYLNHDGILSLSHTKKEKLNKKSHKLFPSLFMPKVNSIDPDEIMKIFSSLTSVYFNSDSLLKQSISPILRMGTIVFDMKEQSFWMCNQPLCDSVRVVNCRKFLFLKLFEKEEEFDLIIKFSGDYKKFLVSKYIYDSKLFIFDGAMNGVKSRYDYHNSAFMFYGKDKEISRRGNVKLKFIAELKYAYAQRIMNNFSANLSRVGLNEFEWLRRS